MRPFSLTTLMLLVACSVASAGGLGEESSARLARALDAVNLSPADLGWDKRPTDDDFRLSCVNETLDEPLRTLERAERSLDEFKDDPAASARAVSDWLDVTSTELLPVTVEKVRLPGSPRAVRSLLELLVAVHRNAELLRVESLLGMTEEEILLLETKGVGLYSDDSDDDGSAEEILAAGMKVDLASLVDAGRVLAEGSERIRAACEELPDDLVRGRGWTVEGLRIALGGTGNDVHDADIVLDLGGDDTYEAGALILDLSGDDTYRGSAGRASFSTSLLIDLQGNDRYQGGTLVQGGAAFGASVLIDVEGDDRYEADQCSQGAAFFGVGMLFDLSGSDTYRGARFVQGFAGVRGLGALSDVAGGDSYRAGGVYSHAPLLPEHTQSLSQGFAFGLRGSGVSGGVGILADHAGNDHYWAEVFGQGASYWYALGILADAEGHDKYDLYQYGQGSGIHLSTGILLDRKGNDAYSCNNGVAQGSGHDWAVGVLWDVEGNDCYQGSGMSQGGANANGLGMLLDEAGNDSYAGWNDKNQGNSFKRRGTHGLGVLLDGGGRDRYTHGGQDDALWTRGALGVGYDYEVPKPDESEQGGDK